MLKELVSSTAIADATRPPVKLHGLAFIVLARFGPT